MSAITTPKTITFIGGNLFQIALDQYGDATQALRLMRVNGLTDYILQGQVTLVIPAPDPTQTGGLPYSV